MILTCIPFLCNCASKFHMMNSTSVLYNSIYSGVPRFEVKLFIAGIDYGMDVLAALKISRTAFGSDSPCLGLAPAGELSVSLYASFTSIPRSCS